MVHGDGASHRWGTSESKLLGLCAVEMLEQPSTPQPRTGRLYCCRDSRHLSPLGTSRNGEGGGGRGRHPSVLTCRAEESLALYRSL